MLTFFLLMLMAFFIQSRSVLIVFSIIYVPNFISFPHFLPQPFCNFTWNRHAHIWFHVLQFWQALSQNDGRWRYSSDNPESSTYAAGNILQVVDIQSSFVVFFYYYFLYEWGFST
jgi:hypothetical protein